MAIDKVHIQHCILYEVQQVQKMLQKRANRFSFLDEDITSYDIFDKQCPGNPRKCDNNDLEQLLTENSVQMQKKACRAVRSNAAYHFQTPT